MLKTTGILVVILAVLGIGVYGWAWLGWWSPAALPPVAGEHHYDEARLHRFETSTVLNPIVGDGDPYAYFSAHPQALIPAPKGTVCAIKFVDADKTRYRIGTYPSASAAQATGAYVTHGGACGTCSTLQDLAVYLRRRDLTTPVRRCGVLGAVKPLAVSCLKALGFTDACAETWYYNTRHTAQMCGLVCLASWVKGDASNKADGSLNDCLACDEAQSGPVFKEASGRTRRNSGIVSSIGRSREEIYPLVHDY